MRQFIQIILGAFLFFGQSQAQMVDLNNLGKLELKFGEIQLQQGLELLPVPAEVAFSPGQNYVLTVPVKVEFFKPLSINGMKVSAGEPIAKLGGVSIQHYVQQQNMIEAQLALLTKPLATQKALLKKQAISLDTYLDLQNQYQALQNQYQTLQVFNQWLNAMDAEPYQYELIAPIAGRIVYHSRDGHIQNIQFIPPENIRLSARLPTDLADESISLITPFCQLQIQQIEQLTDDFFLKAWSEPVKDACKLYPGQTLSVRPHIDQKVLSLPQSAVFTWSQQRAVWLKKGQSLQLQPIQIILSDDDRYLVSYEASMLNQSVLIQSVSAVQGLLLGLGDE